MQPFLIMCVSLQDINSPWMVSKAEACAEPTQTLKSKLFVKPDHNFQPLTFSSKSSILDV